MASNKMGPPCPNCGSHLSDVVSTVRTDDKGFWRHRKCPSCGHRFHTVQPPEMFALSDTVTWELKGKRREPKVDWSWYEAR